VNESDVKTPMGMHTITPHIVVRDAAAAPKWYVQVLGAEERSRLEVPGESSCRSSCGSETRGGLMDR
jgi:uncharacterized glyoxalase superfamily protein PhnB